MYQKYAKLRDSRGLTDYQVAKDLNITKSSFSSWKHGVYAPKADKLKKIADYFGVSLDYLVEEPKKGE